MVTDEMVEAFCKDFVSVHATDLDPAYRGLVRRSLEAALSASPVVEDGVHLGLLDDMDHEAKQDSDAEYRKSELRIQALGAAISRRDWSGVEQAYSAIRDKFYSHSPPTPPGWPPALSALKGKG